MLPNPMNPISLISGHPFWLGLVRRSTAGRGSCCNHSPDIRLLIISAASSEISAENPVKIARTSRKIAAANRIAQIPVRHDKSFCLGDFAKNPSVWPRRSPRRNVDASDSHREIRFECDLDRDVYSLLT
jgi:hypothetical protein